MIIDTHSHIYMNKNTTQGEIIRNLKKDWVEKIISIWIDINTSKKCVELAKKYPWVVYPTIWIHPNDTFEYKDEIRETMNTLEWLIVENLWLIKWIWETWLDYFRLWEENKDKKIKTQKEFFKKHIELAKKYSLPIIIHSRNAKEDTLEILKENNANKVLFHCYAEDLDFAYKVLHHFDECMISFSWIVTFKSATSVRHAASNININNILVETDSPYLAPQAVRWTENIPNNTKYILEEIYKLRKENWKSESLEELREIIYNNSRRFLNI